MRLNKDILVKSFEIGQIPNWSCPTCKHGKLYLGGIVDRNQTKESKNDFQEDYWDFSFVKHRFHFKMKCNNNECQEIVTVAGYTQASEIEEPDSSGDKAIDFFYPQYFYPAIELFEIPEEVPYDVEEQIKLAFKLYWIDDAAFLNALRTTIELILNDKRIRKTGEN
jgi:hypothetical protein